MAQNSDIYCTSYCNHGHRLSDGKPVGHECYVLPTEALRLEVKGDIVGALAAFAGVKLKPHKGIKG